jgi:hypothetical protein
MPRKRSQSEMPGADELYARLIVAQHGLCAVKGCKRQPKTRRFHIDHDHRTGKIRGLLCHWHNRIMPRDGDEARAMADYLDGSPLPAALEAEVIPTLAQMHREVARATPRRKIEPV